MSIAQLHTRTHTRTHIDTQREREREREMYAPFLLYVNIFGD